MQGSHYCPPPILGHCDIYGKIECQAPTAIFAEELHIDYRCPNEVEHSYSVSNMACSLLNISGSCQQMNIFIRIDCELVNASVIPLYGINTRTGNSEHHCIYIRPTEPGKRYMNIAWTFNSSAVNLYCPFM